MDLVICYCPFLAKKKSEKIYQIETKTKVAMPNVREKGFLSREKSTKLTERVLNTADVSLSTKEAQRRRATLSQSPAMQSTLPATVSFV